MNTIKPVGTTKEPYVVKYSDPVNPDELTLKEAIPHLRSLPMHDGEHFPWPLVERHLREQTEPQRPLGSPLPEPQEGYRWIWVSSMARLSGMGGWLEVDPTKKKQARFKFTCMS